MDDISNKTLALLLSVAIVVSLVGIFSAQKGGIVRISGRATDTSTVTFTQESKTAIDVSEAVAWGTGAVSYNKTFATLYSNNATAADGNWTGITQFLKIENIGTTNVSLAIKSSKNSVSFVGGSAATPEFKYNMTDGEAGTCTDGSLEGNFVSFGDAQGDVANEDNTVCALMWNNPTKNELRTYFKVVVPSDAPQTAHSATITYTGTGV